MRSPFTPVLGFLSACLCSGIFTVLARARETDWRIVAREFIELAPAVAEVHASTLAEAADGSLIAAWLGGTREGNPDAAIWVSRFREGKWTPGEEVAGGAGDDGRRQPAWDPVIYRGGDGTLFLFFKVGPSPRNLRGEMMVSRNHGVSWGERRKLPQGMTGPAKNRPLRVGNGTVISPACRVGRDGTAQVWMETSDERFQDWQSWHVTDAGNLGAIQPALIALEEGKILALCRTATGKIARTSSGDSGVSWSPLESTGIPLIDSALDAIALREGGYLLSYNPGEAPENPKDTDPREPRCPLVVSFSPDASAWNPVVTLESRPTRWGYAYPCLLQTADGRVHVTYTWNRGRISHVVIERGAP